MSNSEDMLYPALPKGKLVYESKVVASKPKPKAPPRPRGPVPNIVCYATTAFKDWKPGMVLPKCRRCEAILFPKDNHVCPGFVPKYVEHDEEWEQHQEAKREAIRESNLRAPLTCAGCGDEINCHDDAIYHDEHCGQGGEREMRSLRGDEDDLSGYEDYVEPDYCEGDDDGYDCD
jgi:hypothetical protein